jgi:hypothetical protein
MALLGSGWHPRHVVPGREQSIVGDRQGGGTIGDDTDANPTGRPVPAVAVGQGAPTRQTVPALLNPASSASSPAGNGPCRNRREIGGTVGRQARTAWEPVWQSLPGQERPNCQTVGSGSQFRAKSRKTSSVRFGHQALLGPGAPQNHQDCRADAQVRGRRDIPPSEFCRQHSEPGVREGTGVTVPAGTSRSGSCPPEDSDGDGVGGEEVGAAHADGGTQERPGGRSDLDLAWNPELMAVRHDL